MAYQSKANGVDIDKIGPNKREIAQCKRLPRRTRGGTVEHLEAEVPVSAHKYYISANRLEKDEKDNFAPTIFSQAYLQDTINRDGA